MREHLNLKWAEITARQEVGKNESGTLFEQQVKLDSGICVRRITIQLGSIEKSHLNRGIGYEPKKL